MNFFIYILMPFLMGFLIGHILSKIEKRKYTRYATDEWMKSEDYTIPDTSDYIIIKTPFGMDMMMAKNVNYTKKGKPMRFDSPITHWMWAPENPRN